MIAFNLREKGVMHHKTVLVVGLGVLALLGCAGAGQADGRRTTSTAAPAAGQQKTIYYRKRAARVRGYFAMRGLRLRQVRCDRFFARAVRVGGPVAGRSIRQRLFLRLGHQVLEQRSLPKIGPLPICSAFGSPPLAVSGFTSWHCYGHSLPCRLQMPCEDHNDGSVIQQTWLQI